MTEPILAELARLREAVEYIARDVEALVARGKLTSEERELLGRALPTIAAVVGTAAFTVGDLDEIPTLANAMGSPKSAGRLLLRAQGVTIAGLRVERVGRDRDGALWRLFRR